VTKVLYDLGWSPVDEPFENLFTQGMVTKDGAKMSKSQGNSVSPDEIIEKYGADTARMFTLFAAPPEMDLEWNDQGVEGCFRFLNRVWRLFEELRLHLPSPSVRVDVASLTVEERALRRMIHTTIQRVTTDVEDRFKFNTAISAIMELVNALSSQKPPYTENGRALLREGLDVVARLLGPFAPHIAEELWASLGNSKGLLESGWPVVDESALVWDEVTLVVQVNGRVRARVTIPAGSDEESAKAAALRHENVRRYVEGQTIQKAIYVPDKLLNLVVR